MPSGKFGGRPGRCLCGRCIATPFSNRLHAPPSQRGALGAGGGFLPLACCPRAFVLRRLDAGLLVSLSPRDRSPAVVVARFGLQCLGRRQSFRSMRRFVGSAPSLDVVALLVPSGCGRGRNRRCAALCRTGAPHDLALHPRGVAFLVEGMAPELRGSTLRGRAVASLDAAELLTRCPTMFIARGYVVEMSYAFGYQRAEGVAQGLRVAAAGSDASPSGCVCDGCCAGGVQARPPCPDDPAQYRA